jgi:hypothetical protein
MTEIKKQKNKGQSRKQESPPKIKKQIKLRDEIKKK